MPRKPGSKNLEEKNVEYYAKKLRELGVPESAIMGITAGDQDPEPVTDPAPDPAPALEPEPVIIKKPKTEPQSYKCSICGGPVNKGAESCAQCNEPLSWEGI